MEEEISKFMEGMEKKNALVTKLLQGLLVPEQKNASKMTQAEAFQGGFCVIWTKKRRKGSPHRSVAFMASIHR